MFNPPGVTRAIRSPIASFSKLHACVGEPVGDGLMLGDNDGGVVGANDDDGLMLGDEDEDGDIDGDDDDDGDMDNEGVCVGMA